MRNIAIGIVALAACGPGSRPGGGGEEIDARRTTSADSATSHDAMPDAMLVTYVYAHTASTLFRVDPDTLAITEVGDFVWPTTVVTDQMTDIAIDDQGVMIGVSFDKVYKIDTTTAVTTLLSSSLGESFNGLSFVPAASLGLTGNNVLVGTRNVDGEVFSIDPMTGVTTQVGDMGAYSSSGDLVAVANFGTMQTVPTSTNDMLASLATQTFAATPIGTNTGFTQIWGLAYWKGTVYGFTAGGQFISIDPNTGVGTLISSNGQAWWGAAVTTLAPTIQ